MPLETESSVNLVMFVSSGWDLMTSRLTRRVSGSDACGTIVVNCLLKAVAIARGVDKVVWLKVMGWFGMVGGRLAVKEFIMFQNWEGLYLWEHVSTVLIHFLRLDSAVSRVICRSRACICGSVGLVERRVSRCLISCFVESARLGI